MKAKKRIIYALLISRMLLGANPLYAEVVPEIGEEVEMGDRTFSEEIEDESDNSMMPEGIPNEEQTEEFFNEEKETVYEKQTEEFFDGGISSEEDTGATIIEGFVEDEPIDDIDNPGNLETIEDGADDGLIVDFENDYTDEILDNTDDSSIEEGQCGNQLGWNIYEDGTLVISGSGSMKNYSLEAPAPWKEFSDEIIRAVISDNVEDIGKYAFNGMPYLEEVFISSSVSSIEKGAFRDCRELNTIEVDAQNHYFVVDEGVLYTANHETLLMYPSNIGNKVFEVPENVRVISEYAFYGQSYLEEIVLSSIDIQIGDNAFAECTALTNIAMKEE